jgi:hypothetical protein
MFRAKVLRIKTVVILADMTAFFDTIKAEIMADQLLDEGVQTKIVKFLERMFTQVKAVVRKEGDESEVYDMYPGLRQGGRFSTTGQSNNKEDDGKGKIGGMRGVLGSRLKVVQRIWIRRMV